MYSVLVIYDDHFEQPVAMPSDYMWALEEAMLARNELNQNPTFIQFHWMRISSSFSEEKITDLLLRNVELGVQVILDVVLL